MDKIDGEVIQTILIKLKQQQKKASMPKKKGGIEKKKNKRETETEQ